MQISECSARGTIQGEKVKCGRKGVQETQRYCHDTLFCKERVDELLGTCKDGKARHTQSCEGDPCTGKEPFYYD